MQTISDAIFLHFTALTTFHLV